MNKLIELLQTAFFAIQNSGTSALEEQVKILKEHGIVARQATGKPRKEYLENPEVMAQYLAGQLVDLAEAHERPEQSNLTLGMSLQTWENFVVESSLFNTDINVFNALQIEKFVLSTEAETTKLFPIDYNRTKLFERTEYEIVEALAEKFYEGEEGLETAIAFKKVRNVLEGLFKDERFKDVVSEEVNKHGKAAEMFGFSVTNGTTASWDYSECNSPELNQIMELMALLDKRKKEIILQLKAMTSPRDMQVENFWTLSKTKGDELATVNPPFVMKTQTLKFSKMKAKK